MSKPDHFVSERQALIFAQLQRQGRVSAPELALDFDVSEDTVRRDLREMAARGECERVYGGALLPTGKTVPLKIRLGEIPERKAVLGRTVSSLLRNGMTVFLDAGSTNLAVAKHIASDLELTVVTNTPAIAAELVGRDRIDLILLGGRVDTNVGAAVDITAIRQLEHIRPDLCILGVCGVTMDSGLCADIYEDAAFKRLACETSTQTLAAITSEKLQYAAAFHVRSLAPPLTLVLEESADINIIDQLKHAGVIIHQAGSSLGPRPSAQPKDLSR